AAKQESFVGGAIAAGLNWFWDDATLSDLQTAVSRAWSGTSGCKDEDQEEEEPRPLLESFMAGLSSENGLSQRAQDALATAIMELGSGTKVRVLARVATDASAWLQESAGTVLALTEGHRPSKTESPRSLTVSTAQSTPSAMARYTPSREGRREEASTAAETLLCAFFEEWEQHQPWPQLPPVGALWPLPQGKPRAWRESTDLLNNACACADSWFVKGHESARQAIRSLLTLRALLQRAD
ncbi:unnamed protein product, partial [Effrenium voratum]